MGRLRFSLGWSRGPFELLNSVMRMRQEEKGSIAKMPIHDIEQSTDTEEGLERTKNIAIPPLA